MNNIRTSTRSWLDTPGYAPDALLDALQRDLQAKNDAALAGALGVYPPLLSKIRRRHLPVSASFLVRAYLRTGVPLETLCARMGVDLKSL